MKCDARTGRRTTEQARAYRQWLTKHSNNYGWNLAMDLARGDLVRARVMSRLPLFDIAVNGTAEGSEHVETRGRRAWRK